MPFIQYDHKPLFFTLRRSERAKRLHMVVRAQSFEVVAPKRISNRVILDFVCQQRRWMSKQLTQQAKRTTALNAIWPKAFLHGETVPFRGSQLHLNVRYGAVESVLRQEDSLLITLSWQRPCVQLESEIKKQLHQWYQAQAMMLIEASLAHFCPILGRWPKAVQLKQQKSRWGSCGVTQQIYLNWLLVLAPPGILEYVVVHELVHLIEPSHNKRFVGLMDQHYPAWREATAELNQIPLSAIRPRG